MIEEVEGIVISVTDYGETSKILNVLTKKYGIIGVISKGCKKLKSDLRSVSDRLTYGKFNIFYKENKLSNLISVDVMNNFKNIKLDIEKISYASFLLELSSQVSKHQFGLSVYDYLISALIKINDGFDPLVITNIIELKFLDLLGVMPMLDGCVVCGSTSGIVTISSYKGGYLCKKCCNNEKYVDLKTIKLLRMFYYVDINKISKIDISNKCKYEINDFLDEYYDRYTGLYLKSKSFIKMIYE